MFMTMPTMTALPVSMSTMFMVVFIVYRSMVMIMIVMLVLIMRKRMVAFVMVCIRWLHSLSPILQ